MVEFEDIEKAILCQVAGKVVEALPEEERKKILEGSLTKALTEILRPWHVEKAIEKDVHKYMLEYISQPEVQKRIKESTEKAVDMLMEGVVNSIVISSQDAIKSDYRKFIEKKEEK